MAEDAATRRAFYALSLTAFLLFVPRQTLPQSLLFKNYTTQDGLPDSRVAPIIQDRKGYLWFGTQAGLTRYDGKEFLSFGPARDIPGIFGRYILEDRAGAIWFAYSGFREGGVSRYWNGRVDHIGSGEGLHGRQASQITEGADGDLWIVSDAGLERLRFTDSLRSAWTISGPIDSSVTAVYPSRRGPVYYTKKTGLFAIRDGVIDTIHAEPDTARGMHVRSYSFYEADDGGLWFGGYTGAYYLRNGRLLAFGPESGIPERGVWCFQKDSKGNFFAGTMEGLYRVRQSGDRVRFVKERSFGDGVVYDMCLDREGNLWLASAPGLRRMLGIGVVRGFRGEEFLSSVGVGAIRRSHDGRAVCFASRSSGLYIYRDDRVDQPILPLPDKALTITDVIAEEVAGYWLGLWRGGVVHLVGKKRMLFTEEEGLPSNSVHSLLKTQSGSVVVGTAAGAALIHDGKTAPLDHPLLNGRTIFDLKASGADTIWAGTDDGARVIVLRNDSLLSVADVPGSGLHGGIVYVVLIDSRHRLWFGTDDAGVRCFDGKEWRWLTRSDGLTGNRVFALAEDSLGSIWVGTASGLSCYDGATIHNLMFDQGFGEIGMHGLLTDGDGSLWVSNYPGVTRLQPSRLPGSKTPPPLDLTEVLLDSARLDLRPAPELPPDPAILTFRFAALSFTDERNVRYRYYLEGFDREWSGPVSAREVRYTHLPRGSYRFMVTACSGEGIWTVAPVTFSFTILPPVWARWWFLTAAVALVGGSIYAGYRYRLNKLLQIERTRNRIAMDLHDDLGSTLTRISVMTEVAQRNVDTDHAGAKEYLSRIGESARDLIESLGDIVWTVDPKHDDLQNVVRRIVEFGQELCEGRGIAFETELLASFESARLTPDERREIYLFFKEGFNNLIKHSGATRARFCVRAVRNGALLELLDNGSGIPDNVRESGHGLRSLRERGERIGAGVSFGRANGEGTRLSLEIKTG